jgi:hypothetical protein
MANALKATYIKAFTNPWTIWPFQAFPANSFKGFTQQRLQEARIAWVFYENTESADAEIRLSYGLRSTGIDAICVPSIWTSLQDQEKQKHYNYGQSLHNYVCPEIDWTSQRNLPPSTGPFTLNLTISLPPPVSNITFKQSDQTIIVGWKNTASIKYFTVVSNPDNLIVIVDGSRLSATMSGLTNDVLYSFSITATDYYDLTSVPIITDLVPPIGQNV